jgi:hypothetical protein
VCVIVGGVCGSNPCMHASRVRRRGWWWGFGSSSSAISQTALIVIVIVHDEHSSSRVAYQRPLNTPHLKTARPFPLLHLKHTGTNKHTNTFPPLYLQIEGPGLVQVHEIVVKGEGVLHVLPRAKAVLGRGFPLCVCVIVVVVGRECVCVRKRKGECVCVLWVGGAVVVVVVVVRGLCHATIPHPHTKPPTHPQHRVAHAPSFQRACISWTRALSIMCGMCAGTLRCSRPNA